MNALISSHAMSFPHPTVKQREGATHVATIEKTGAKVFELGRDSFTNKDIQTLKSLLPSLKSIRTISASHSILALIIERLQESLKQQTLGQERIYIALDSNNRLLGGLKGLESDDFKKLHELTALEKGIGSVLFSLFCKRSPIVNEISVHKATDSKYQFSMLCNDWVEHNLSSFYEAIGFKGVTKEEMKNLTCPFSHIKAWCDKKFEKVTLVNNATPQALVISGLGDGNTITP